MAVWLYCRNACISVHGAYRYAAVRVDFEDLHRSLRCALSLCWLLAIYRKELSFISPIFFLVWLDFHFNVCMFYIFCCVRDKIVNRQSTLLLKQPLFSSESVYARGSCESEREREREIWPKDCTRKEKCACEQKPRSFTFIVADMSFPLKSTIT